MIDLAKYANMKICVAVSGGRDSMALLHYLHTHAAESGITLSALNCDHKIRGEASARDSRFVKNWCAQHKIPLLFFEWDSDINKTESSARLWRLSCYTKAVEDCTLADGTKWRGVDAVATAHHMNDNAETVLFNLARGSALSGLDGITDYEFPAAGDKYLQIIHPLVSCSRSRIDEYIGENNIPYVDDESNFNDDYTRNRIRHNVLPQLEQAVPGAAKAIYRFSRFAAEDERYFDNLIEKRKLIKDVRFGKEIAFCEEKVVFRRAAVKVIKVYFNKKDYTSEHAERLYSLQFAENGKKFGFLGLTAYKEDGKIVITDDGRAAELAEGRSFKYHAHENFNLYAEQYIRIVDEAGLAEEIGYINQNAPADSRFPQRIKTLKFDFDSIPQTAVIRFIRDGDKFTKFGGGTKNLGDYFTDKKIPVRVRRNIPLIAVGNEILAVCGVEISDKIKITKNTKHISFICSADYTAQ